MLELKAATANLLYNFNLEPIDFANKIPFMPDLVIRPARPIYIKFIPIKKWFLCNLRKLANLIYQNGIL